MSLGDADGGGAGCLTEGHAPTPTPGEQGCAEGSAFFGGEEFDRVAVDVGLDLPPERAAGAAAAEPDAFDGDAEFARRG